MTAYAADLHGSEIADQGVRTTAPCDTLQAFASAIVHDLNNVLTAVIGNLSLLREEQTLQDAGHMAIVNETLAASRRGAYLVEAVEALTGQLRLNPEPTDINRLIFTAMAGLRRRLDRLELRTRLSHTAVTAQVDGAMLRRAITGTAMCLAHEICSGAHTLTIEASSTRARSGTGSANIVMTCDGDCVRKEALNLAHNDQRSHTLLRNDEWRLASVAGFLAQSGGRMTAAVQNPRQVRIALYLPAASGKQADGGRDVVDEGGSAHSF